MSTFSIFLVLIIIVAFLLVLVIMVQNPKGGGLASTFGGGGSQVVGGVKKTGDFLDKSTWTLATVLIVLILLSNLTLRSGSESSESKILEGEDIENVVPDEIPQVTPEATPSADEAPEKED